MFSELGVISIILLSCDVFPRYQFPPMNPLWHGLLGFTIGILGVVSVIGNGMVIFIFGGQKVITLFRIMINVKII